MNLSPNKHGIIRIFEYLITEIEGAVCWEQNYMLQHVD